MKLYLFYILTALLTAWIILFLYGFSGGFASFLPIAALLGSVLLFVVAAPLLVYKVKPGLIIGLTCCVLILPYFVVFASSILDDAILHWGMLIAIMPVALTLFSIYFTMKPLVVKDAAIGIRAGAVVKLLMAIVPVALFLLYLIFYGKYWNWQMFIIK
jgi:hypothetical protein